MLFQDPNIDEGFIVAEDMDRSLVVKENPFPWQPDLANIPVAVKKNCLLLLPSSIPCMSIWISFTWPSMVMRPDTSGFGHSFE